MEIKDFWNRIKKICKEKETTQQELSKMLGYGARNLEMKISRNSIPTIMELAKISEIFGVSCDYLINGESEKIENQKIQNDKSFLQKLNKLHPIEQNVVKTLVNMLYEQQKEKHKRLADCDEPEFHSEI